VVITRMPSIHRYRLRRKSKTVPKNFRSYAMEKRQLDGLAALSQTEYHWTGNIEDHNDSLDVRDERQFYGLRSSGDAARRKTGRC
jgi:hypothetical protein